jgi:hypothetical protein
MSYKTTIFGPRLSVKSGGEIGTNDPGLGGFDVSVPLILSGVNSQTVKAGLAGLQTGQLSIISLSVTSAVLAFKSGNTVYAFTNVTAE